MFHVKHLPVIIILLLSIFRPLSTSSADVHKFYMSLTEIEHNPRTQSLECTMHLFTDDLELALEQFSGLDINLGLKDEHPSTDSLLQAYINTYFTIAVNGKSTKPTVIGKEVEIDKTYCYVEVVKQPKVASVSITNQILMEVYSDQKNIVHVRAHGKKRSLYLRKGKPDGTLQFQP